MKKQLVILLSVVFVWSFASAQTPIDEIEEGTVLFEISKPGSEHTSYLFGTHHAFGKVFFDSLANANRALSSCNVLIEESLSIPGQTVEEIINKRTRKTDWKKYLDKDDLAFIENLFKSSPTDFKKLTPTEMHVFLIRYFKQQVCLSKAAADTSLSLDGYIRTIAEEQHLKLVGLETAEEQIQLINKDVEGMPRKIHKKRLGRIVEQIRTENTSNCAETDWYSKMNIDYQFEKPCQNSLMLTERNIKWMKTIVNLLETDNCFIAVGLSHFMFQCGLILELKDRGYSVIPVPLN